MVDEREHQMRQVAEAIQNLTESPLYAYRQDNGYHSVVGEGDLWAEIMFVGEAPGKREAQLGRPFVGASGRVLDEFLASIQLNREDVYITNVVKDRPPDNRDPKDEEIQLYGPFLLRQIEIVRPKVVATLGRFAMTFFLRHFDLPQVGQRISDLHGRLMNVEASYGDVALIPLYHPAVALYNRSRRGVLEEDFQLLRQFID
jgi:DNA polymerase